MTNSPFFSVIIPTYNQVETLEQTIAGLCNQTYPKEKFEIIVVDDGSQDGTLEYLENIARFGELIYISQQNVGPGSARNIGAKKARGEILAFIDHDCIPKRDWLERFAEFYKRHPRDSTYATGGRIKPLLCDSYLYRFYRVQGICHQSNRKPEPQYLDTANATFPRSVFWSVGGFNEIFPFACDDVELGLRLRLAGVELKTCQRAVVWHKEPIIFSEFIAKSYRYGYGAGIMRAEYPDYCYVVPSGGIGSIVNRFLGRVIDLAIKAPPPVRAYVYGCSVAIREIAFWLPELRYFICKYLVKQIIRYKRFNCSTSGTLVYLVLESCDYFPQLIGRLAGLVQFSIRRIKQKACG